MARPGKAALLEHLPATRIRLLADRFDLQGERRSKSAMIDAFVRYRKLGTATLLEGCTADDLRSIAGGLGIAVNGGSKTALVERLLGGDPKPRHAKATKTAVSTGPPEMQRNGRPKTTTPGKPPTMSNGDVHWITNYIWGIADDVLRDLYVRGKYRDVILPMTVLRRLDAVLEPTKQAVLDMKKTLDQAKIANQDQALRQAAGQSFYNTSKFTLRDLRARTSQQQLRADFEAYLDGFSPNVQDILENFEFRNQIPRLTKADALGALIEKLLSHTVNLAPGPVLDEDGQVRLPGLDNHGMGTVFEELVRRFNEENNEEAGEHWTPRDAVRLMARLIFEPVADQIKSGSYLLYDGACGTGGMLTVAEETLQHLAEGHGKQVVTHLYGQEINAETYAIAKADLLLKGEGEAADNIVGGPEHSTLANDAFPGKTFDFMLSNPPYGKSYKNDLERMGGKKELRDPRFVISHGDEPEFSLITRSSDGQMLFLANMVSKMRHDTPLGSRIAEVHNGSSLFTGDAGQGESNIRRWIIENDWLEAIIALPLNMFYNTGIATYIWVVTNRKPEHRRGKVQLIDATAWSKPLRKNLGKKNCELSDEDIARIMQVFHDFQGSEQSKIFPNRGLDPNVRLKDSGLEWVGPIPEHWSCCRLRNLVSLVTSGSRGWSDYAADSGPLFLRIANLKRMSLDLRFDDAVRLKLPEQVEGIRTRTKDGDLLISITAYIGSIGVVPDQFEVAYVSQHVALARLRGLSCPRWVGYVLLSSVGHGHGQRCLYGGTKDGLSLDDVKSYPVLLPPLHEQQQLASHIDNELHKVAKVSSDIQGQIALAQEYRTRLIADVVTGKLDVREAAAQLPDEDPAIDDDTPLKPDEAADLDEALDEMEEVDA